MRVIKQNHYHKKFKSKEPDLVDIPGYEGEYAYDKARGEIWSYKSNRYLRPSLGNAVALCKNGVRKNIAINRIALAIYQPEKYSI